MNPLSQLCWRGWGARGHPLLPSSGLFPSPLCPHCPAGLGRPLPLPFWVLFCRWNYCKAAAAVAPGVPAPAGPAAPGWSGVALADGVLPRRQVRRSQHPSWSHRWAGTSHQVSEVPGGTRHQRGGDRLEGPPKGHHAGLSRGLCAMVQARPALLCLRNRRVM